MSLSRGRLAVVVGCLGAALGLVSGADLTAPPLGLPRALAKTDRAGAHELSRARITSRVIGQLRAQYVDPTRLEPKAMLTAALERVEADVPEIRVEATREAGVVTGLRVTVLDATRDFGLTRVRDLYELNWKLMEIYAFIEGAMPAHGDLEGLEYAAINGMLDILDPHSSMLSPRQWRELQLSQRGRFGGIGIVVGVEDGALRVRQVLPETPAAEAGLVPGDRITVIGEQSTATMTLDEAVTLLRGEPGTEITLWVTGARDTRSRPVPVRRREIQTSGVDGHPLGDGIGYVRVRSFQETTDQDVVLALERLEAQPGGLTGLILDLRDNPGGLLEKAIALSDLFLDRGTIVTTVREGGRERDERHAKAAETRLALPLLVLVNRGSASASEIVAGALRNHDRALIVGQRTFGKGSVQVVYRMDDAALKMTVAQYLTPGDVSIQGVGVTPDVAVATLRPPVGSSFLGMDLQPTPEDAGGERSLTGRLASDRTRAETPPATLRLLEGREIPAASGGFAPDALTRAAAEMLRSARLSNRRAMLAALGGHLAQQSRATGVALGQQLAGLEVDWQEGPRPSRPRLTMELSIRPAREGAVSRPASPPDFEVRAGEEVLVTVAVQNLGPQPVYRAHVELGGTSGLFRGLEVALGRVEPGAKAERAVKVRVPLAVTPAADRVAAHLYLDGVEVQSAMTERFLRVAGVSPPRLAHVHAIADTSVTDAPLRRGNGDGLLQRGERVYLEVWVENLADAPTPGPVGLSLRNLSGSDVIIHAARAELPELGPRRRELAQFEIELRQDFRSRFVDLQLDFDDGLGQVGQGGSRVALSLPVHPEGLGAVRSATGFAAVSDGDVRLHAGAHRDTPVLATLGVGGIFDVVAETDGWLKLALKDAGLARPKLRRLGWVAAGDVRRAAEGAVLERAVMWHALNEPPELTLTPPQDFVEASRVSLRGQVRFSGAARGIVQVFRGSDKVFFRPVPLVGGDSVTVPLELEVALEPGRNDLVIVAREGDDRVTRRSLAIFRR
jgi:carboxyl-terminal processing protease